MPICIWVCVSIYVHVYFYMYACLLICVHISLSINVCIYVPTYTCVFADWEKGKKEERGRRKRSQGIGWQSDRTHMAGEERGHCAEEERDLVEGWVHRGKGTNENRCDGTQK